MTTATEIKNKEKSLAELMVKILKEPLNPLEISLKELKDDLLDTQEKIAEINDMLGVSALDTEKTNKTLRRIRDDDFPALATSLQEYILNQVERASQKISTALDVHSNCHNENLKSVSDVLLEKLAKTADQQNGLRQLIEELRASLDLKIEVVQAATQSTLNEIQLSRALSERSNSDLAVRLDTNHDEMLTGLKDVSIEFQTVMAENLRIEQAVSKAIENNRIALIEVLGQQNAATIATISAGQSKLKKLTITTSIFFALMLIYVGHDIWSKLN